MADGSVAEAVAEAEEHRLPLERLEPTRWPLGEASPN